VKQQRKIKELDLQISYIRDSDQPVRVTFSWCNHPKNTYRYVLLQQAQDGLDFAILTTAALCEYSGSYQRDKEGASQDQALIPV